mgnify:FL=1
MRFLIQLLGSMVGIYSAAAIVPGIVFESKMGWQWTLLDLFLLALILAAVNAIIRPVFKFLTFPLYILTLGLFSLVTSALMFLMVSWLAGKFSLPFVVMGFWPALWGGVVTAVVSWFIVGILSPLVPKRPVT